MGRVALVSPEASFERRVVMVMPELRNTGLSRWREEYLRIDPTKVVADLAKDGVEVVCLGPGLAADVALGIAAAFERESPDIFVILVAEPTPELWLHALRTGVRDVVAPAGELAELARALSRALRTADWRFQARDEAARPQHTSRIITVLSPKGGAGKTTVATNLALGLATVMPGQVAIIDLDVQFGDVATALRLAPSAGLANVAACPDEVTPTMVKVFLTAHQSGLYALCAPDSPGEGENITHIHSAAALRVLAGEFAAVVVDTGAGLQEHTLAAIELSTDLVLVTTTDVTSVRSLRKALDALDQLGMTTQRRHFVLNRSDAKMGLSLSDIEGVVGMKSDIMLPSSAAVSQSMNLGSPVMESDPRSAIALQMQKLVSEFDRRAPQPQTEPAPAPAQVHGFPEEEHPMKLGDRLKQLELHPIDLDPDEASPGPAPVPTLKLVHEAADEGRPGDPLADLKERASAALFARLGMRLFDASLGEDQLRTFVVQEIGGIMEAESAPLTPAERQRLVAEIGDDILGHGPIEQFLADPTVTEIMVNSDQPIYIERAGKLHRTTARFRTQDHLRRVIERIVSQVGRRIDESSPMVDARLADGSRVNTVIPPLAVDGPVLTIRKFSKDPYQVADLIGFGTMTAEMAVLLASCVRGKLNILVTGATGTGKTTMLNVLSSFIPEDDRVVTIEDSVELQLRQPHVVRLESRPANIEGKGQVAIRDLMRNALRMRPDRIVVGEVRGGEALDMLQAMNTGHDGSLSTVHANSPRDTLARIETMVLMAGMDLPSRAIREQVASALDLIVHVSRFRDGTRRITHVTEVEGMEGDIVTLQDIFLFDYSAGIDSDGRFLGSAIPTGLRPRFAAHLADLGIDLPASVFGATDVLAAARRRPR